MRVRQLHELSHRDLGFLLGCQKMGIDPRELGVEPGDLGLDEWPWQTVARRRAAAAAAGGGSAAADAGEEATG